MGTVLHIGIAAGIVLLACGGIGVLVAFCLAPLIGRIEFTFDDDSCDW